jgi:predicted O-methyltransferase YrrM
MDRRLAVKTGELFLPGAAYVRRNPRFEAERDRKLELAGRLRSLMTAVESGAEFRSRLDALLSSLPEPDWPPLVSETHSRWLKVLASSHEASFRQGLAGFLSSTDDPVQRFDRFVRTTKAAGIDERPRAALAFGSLFNFAVEPRSLPIIQPRLFERIEQRLGWQRIAEGGLTERYEDHLAFARNIEAAMRSAGIPLRDMLDVQSLILATSEHTSSWAPEVEHLRKSFGTRAADLTERAMEFSALQKPEELCQLLNLVERQRLESVVEIGTYGGGTLLCWCQLAEPEATIVSVDLPGGAFGGGYTPERREEMRRLFPRAGQKLHLIGKDSHESSTVEAVKECLQGREVDLLFIDGDHTYEGVKQDFEMYGPLVKRSGLIAFHDILPNPLGHNFQVAPFWREVKNRHRHVELVAGPSCGGGIGVAWQR